MTVQHGEGCFISTGRSQNMRLHRGSVLTWWRIICRLLAQFHRNTFEALCGIFQSHSLPPSLSCEVFNLELVVVTTAFTTCIYRCPQSWLKIRLTSSWEINVTTKWVQLCGVCETGRLNINMNYICHLHVNNPLHKWIYHINPHSSTSTLISLSFTFSFPPFVHLFFCWRLSARWCRLMGACVSVTEHVMGVFFTTNSWISDWSGNWSDPARSHYRSPSSVLNLVHSGEMFRSTSSTDTTEHREREREWIYLYTLLKHGKICSTGVCPFYLEAVFKLLTDKVEGNWVDARV